MGYGCHPGCVKQSSAETKLTTPQPIKKFEPDQLKPGDKLEPFSASDLNGETVMIDFARGGPRRLFNVSLTELSVLS